MFVVHFGTTSVDGITSGVGGKSICIREKFNASVNMRWQFSMYENSCVFCDHCDTNDTQR